MKSESNTLAHTISFRAIFLDFKETLKRVGNLFFQLQVFCFDQKIILSMVSSDYVSNWWVLHG
jgi:hypothetical protein